MEEVAVLSEETDKCMDMPPGFRFHPTDEEIITHYLSNKVLDNNFSARAMGEVDLNKCEPWELPKKAKMGEKEWYFFCQRDRKYPTGMRTNRATESGYWKATGKDKEIYNRGGGGGGGDQDSSCLVGMKKTLVFYKGRAPKGEKSNWVMHEFRLEGKFSHHNLSQVSKNEWVVCKVFHKSSSSYIEDTDDGHDERSTIIAPKTSDEIHTPYMSSYMAISQQLDHNNIPSHSISYPYHISGYLHHHIRNNSIQNFPTSGYGTSTTPDMALLRSALSATGEASSYLKGLCKVDKLSYNQSMISQGTGLSAEAYAEISSETSKHDQMGTSRCYEDLEGLASTGPIDLECLWNY